MNNFFNLVRFTTLGSDGFDGRKWRTLSWRKEICLLGDPMWWLSWQVGRF